MIIFLQSIFKFVGRKTRTKEQLQSLMYCEEMEQWLAEERLEEARSQARLLAVLQRSSQPRNDDEHYSSRQNSNLGSDEAENGQTVQVVDDEDELTTIRRPVLPDLRLRS